MDKKEMQKAAAARAAAAYIKNHMTIGLGTGSTAYYLIREVGGMLEHGMQLRAVVTSEKTRELARSFHIPVIMPEEAEEINLAIDGVDEIDKDFCAVKGGGGALLREKIVAYKADEVIWIMDESKLKEKLGAFPLPVEVLPFGSEWAAEAISSLGGKAVLRYRDKEMFVTDNGNAILDITLPSGPGPQKMDYRKLSEAASKIPGVLETGFFEAVCSRIIVGTPGGVREIINKNIF